MKVKVKICGIRTLVAAQTAVDAGADFLGFNFVNASKRYIKPELAKKIIDRVKNRVKILGVFQNAKIDYVNKIVKLLDLDFIQLHEKRVIKSLKNKTTYKLVDRKIQGTGQTPNLEEAEELAKKSKIFFAGGLDRSNVAQIIKKVKPFAVDVASGIETDGIENINKIKEFIKNTKEV